MSLKLNERYPLRFNNPSAQYPQGSFKNRSAPNAKDGSYLEKDWANDKEGFFQRLLVVAGIAPNGLVDTAENSQYFDALNEIINSSVSVPDATTLLKGIVRLATITESNTGTSQALAVTPAGVMSLITSLFPKRTFVASDYIRIPDVPGGLIIQWGTLAGSPGQRTITYPIAFPTEALHVFMTPQASQTTTGTFNDNWVNSFGNSNATVFMTTNATLHWFAIGV